VPQDPVDDTGFRMKETIFICAPQAHRRGSTSKILRSKRAEEALRARLESISPSSSCCCTPDGRQLWSLSPAIVTRDRFPKAKSAHVSDLEIPRHSSPLVQRNPGLE
jgi:hypothetical protein